MRRARPRLDRISTIDAHVAGQPMRLVVGGAPGLIGSTVAEKLAYAQRRLEPLRQALMQEPRGHRDLAGALLVAPSSPEAQAAVIFMRSSGWTPMIGHGLIAVATIALERQLLMLGEQAATFRVETAAGLVEIHPERAVHPRSAPDGDAERVTAVGYVGPPARVVAAGTHVTAAGKRFRADIVQCGGLVALVDAESCGVATTLRDLPGVRSLGQAIAVALDGALTGSSPAKPRRSVMDGAIDAVVFTGQAHGEAHLRAIPVYPGGVADRSPSGVGTAAVLAVLDAMEMLPPDGALQVEGLSGLTLRGEVRARIDQDGLPSIVPMISGTAWMTGEHVFVLDREDPLRLGISSEF